MSYVMHSHRYGLVPDSKCYTFFYERTKIKLSVHVSSFTQLEVLKFPENENYRFFLKPVFYQVFRLFGVLLQIMYDFLFKVGSTSACEYVSCRVKNMIITEPIQNQINSNTVYVRVLIKTVLSGRTDSMLK